MDENQIPQPEPEEELPEFSLDDIMKEFALQPGETLEEDETEAPEAPEEPEEPEEPAQAPAEEAPEAPAEETPQMPAEAPVPEEGPEEAEGPAEGPVTGDTIRMDAIRVEPEHRVVKGAAPIEDEAETQEPFSDQWEPEYEQPMGEYAPPQPIVIHPRSRLRELKRKLVAGPEKRYYTLAEKGVGKLQAAVFLNILVVLLSAGSTVMYAMNMVQPERLRLMIFCQCLAMLLSALLGCYQMIQGAADLFRGRFTMKTLLTVTFIVCCADGWLCLQELRVPCCAAFSLEMTMAMLNTYHTRSAEMGQMDTMRKAVRLDSLLVCPDYYEGRNGLLRGEGEVEDFMDCYSAPSGPDKALCWYALAALVASAGIGAAAGMLYGLSSGIQVGAVCLLAATPATMFITTSRPAAIVTKRLHAVGSVLCGWQGVKALGKKSVFPVSYSDLFPAGSARMNGVKFFSNRQPDEIVAYCTAVVCANGSGLSPLFQQVLDSRNGRHYDARELTYYDGGIGAIVEEEAVLVGSLAFLKEMGVELPEGIRVNQAVCIAIDGELCGLFALTYENNRAAAAGLASLCGNGKSLPVFAGEDFLLTESFLRSRFTVRPRRLLIPDHEACVALQEKSAPEDARAVALVTRNSLASWAYAISGARALGSASRTGVAVHMLGGVAGIAVMTLLVLMGRLDLLTPANMFAYQLVWMIPGFLITEWARAC